MPEETPAEAPGFAPDEPTDGRKAGEWTSRYLEKEAKRAIAVEAIYLAFHLALSLSLLAAVAANIPEKLLTQTWSEVKPFTLAWAGGLLGGTLFDIKWLYHSVAKNLWNLDRRLWRLFTPYLSSTLALVVALLISSRLFRVFDPTVLDSPSASVAIGFLAGYSSDNAVAKLIEISETLFGTHSHHRRG